jgi:hypothetical protein
MYIFFVFLPAALPFADLAMLLKDKHITSQAAYIII